MLRYFNYVYCRGKNHETRYICKQNFKYIIKEHEFKVQFEFTFKNSLCLR